MESDNEVRKKVKEKSEKSRLAVMEGGSSYAALGDLIDVGHSVYHRELFPRLVEGSWNRKIRHITTSGTHTVAITESGWIEPVRIHNGAEENKGALRKSRGEDGEAFQILEYQARKGNVGGMYKIGLLYSFGLRGLRRDCAKALAWFSKVADRGEPQSMEFLGEIYAAGAGVERNYTKALEWLALLDSSFIQRTMEWGICMSRAMKWKRKITPQ
ncbi:hypothetical protein Patl1_33129 [Pistacia atlantica]|uniref:Uncharacterized protein n=1 Tax=Pistacia atlantica TaxID=434234 RepID=A0ACC1AQ69_9ROSI|nr:hypothetical protein Patl1_33129 [Pistacia atlantica]